MAFRLPMALLLAAAAASLALGPSPAQAARGSALVGLRGRSLSTHTLGSRPHALPSGGGAPGSARAHGGRSRRQLRRGQRKAPRSLRARQKPAPALRATERSLVLRLATEAGAAKRVLRPKGSTPLRVDAVEPGSRFKDPIKYHGGPILAGATLNVYLIFYGSWTGNKGEAVLQNFVNSLSASDAASSGKSVPSAKEWWAISTAYTQKDGSTVSAQVKVGKTVFVTRNFKTSLREGAVEQVVKDQLSQGNVPVDPNGFYAVITSSEIREGSSQAGFCSDYCGWHSATQHNGKPIAYAFVGDPSTQCLSSCGTGDVTPTGFPHVDNLLSTFAHELTEAATDPDTSTGWFSSEGEENADLCAWTFTDAAHPVVARDPQKGYSYNMVGLGGQRYLVQANADKDKQQCVLSAGGSSNTDPPPPPDGGDAPPPAIALPPESGAVPAAEALSPSPSDGCDGAPSPAPSPGLEDENW